MSILGTERHVKSDRITTRAATGIVRNGWRGRQRQLYQHEWVVYAKTSLGGPAQVLDYLSRYTHRTTIGNERIRAISQGEGVFSVREDDQGGKRRIRQIGTEFIRRFLLQVLPSGIKRIRHYGVLASGCKSHKLQARAPARCGGDAGQR